MESATRSSIQFQMPEKLNQSVYPDEHQIKKKWKEAKKSFGNVDSFRKSILVQTLDPKTVKVTYQKKFTIFKDVSKQLQDFNQALSTIQEGNEFQNTQYAIQTSRPLSHQKKKSLIPQKSKYSPPRTYNYDLNKQEQLGLAHQNQPNQMKLSRLVASCVLNNKNPHPSSSFYYRFKRANQSSAQELRHLQKDRLQLLMDKAQHTFDNKKKQHEIATQRVHDRLDRSYAKDYVKFQRSLENIDIQLANYALQQLYQKQPNIDPKISNTIISGEDSVRNLDQLNLTQNNDKKNIVKRFREKIMKKDLMKNTPQGTIEYKRGQSKGSQRIKKKLSIVTNNSFKNLDTIENNEHQNNLDKEFQQLRLSPTEIQFDKVLLEKYQEFYQMQHSMSQDQNVKSKFKKEPSQDKASRLIKLNIIRDKQQSNVMQVLLDKNKKKVNFQQLSANINGNQQKKDSKSQTHRSINNSIYKDSSYQYDLGGLNVAPFESSINFVLSGNNTGRGNSKTRNQGDQKISRTKNNITNNDLTSDRASSVERGSYLDEDYIMQSRFDRSLVNINQTTQSLKKLNENSNINNQPIIPSSQGQSRQVINGRNIGDNQDISQLKKLVSTMDNNLYKKSLMNSIRNLK
ncbi:UNKNOWN [Stylonychia lemnae]|uniref:Uncharacterized protein n=1 Tax=Stylonychia lemnae TaxID=5949 RepID=A0A078B2N7_STYLE|nr:UNKNOWN [Stylonychia lemnae]|eukprot:CDW88501.1 UNKNOWN [Stylonychia lemnae]